LAPKPIINPYESPRVTTTSTLEPHPELVGTLARRRWAYRKIEVRGRFDAVIEYDGRGMGYETVLLNGLPVARVTSTGITFRSPIDFEIPVGNASHHARIEIRTAFALFVRASRLLIDGQLVFQEGAW
jgi:hypothetical protein